MELVWKHERLSSIPFLKSFIPFHTGIFHIPYRNFRSIPYHALVVDSLLLLLLLHFPPTGVDSLKIRKRLILKKLLPLPASFLHFRFRVRLRFQSLSLKCFRFHKKLTASASTSLDSAICRHCNEKPGLKSGLGRRLIYLHGCTKKAYCTQTE